MLDMQQKHDRWMSRYNSRKGGSFEEYTRIIESNNSFLKELRDGAAYVSSGSFNEAIRLLTKSIDIGSQLFSDDNMIDAGELAKAYAGRGMSCQQTGEYLKAASDFGNAIKVWEGLDKSLLDENELAKAYAGRGMAYYPQGNAAKTVQNFNKSIEIWERLRREGKPIENEFLVQVRSILSTVSSTV